VNGLVAFVVSGILGAFQAAVPAGEGRKDLAESQVKALREKNIFSPFRTEPFKPPGGSLSGGSRGTPSAPPPPARPKAPVVTGIVYDAASGAFLAIVEDKSDEKLRRLDKPRFLKAGDEVLGVRIEAVAKDKVTVVHGEARHELEAGTPLPDTAPPGPEGAAAPAAAPASAPAGDRPADPGAVNSVLEELRRRNQKKDRKYDEP